MLKFAHLILFAVTPADIGLNRKQKLFVEFFLLSRASAEFTGKVHRYNSACYHDDEYWEGGK